MATSTGSSDYFSSRTSTRPRPGAAGLQEWRASPQTRSPRTPTLGRSISHQLSSPGGLRVEQEEVVIYELGARHFSAGFAGESRPRCILPFTPEGNRRIGDYRQYASDRVGGKPSAESMDDWGTEYELYKTDLRELDLGLVEDKLDRTLRTAMIEYLQLDTKPRKAFLVLPSLLPTPLLEVVIKVLFGHFTQPPSVALLTQPAMCCVSAGVRHGLVVDIGWEETVVAAVSEYKEINQRRSIRAGKLLTREMANTLSDSSQVDGASPSGTSISFSMAEDITQRMAWCKRQQQASVELGSDGEPMVSTRNGGLAEVSIPFNKLAEPAERALFMTGNNLTDHDDHDLPIQLLVYKALLALPMDVRALCVSRIIVIGGVSNLPGLKRRLLQEVTRLIDIRGWDPVCNYGSANSDNSPTLQGRPQDISFPPAELPPTVPLSPSKRPLQEAITHAERVHDDIKDPITAKVDLAISKGKAKPVKGVVRGVETLGPWAGASLVGALRIKGVHEVDRESFSKHGLRSTEADL